VRRLAAVLFFALAAFGMVVPSANAAAPAEKLAATDAALWTKVLQTPSAQNAFGSGDDAFACWDLGGTVAPLTPSPSGVASCTVKPGTKIFVAASSFECSTFEGLGTTDAELRACARQVDVQLAPIVTVDGKPVPVAEVETQLLNIVLPAGNLFEQPAGTRGLSVGHGWLTLLHPLTPGTHTIAMDLAGPPPSTITTTILVKPGG
jgi:hypothetical protein